MLSVCQVLASYGTGTVLFGVSLKIEAGEVVALLGRNGMGKTTLIRSIMGLTPAVSGSIKLNGQELSTSSPNRIARLGIGLVPEGRQIFPNLTVEENLVVASVPVPAGKSGWDLNRVYELFPLLLERKDNMGNQLSGGEQQMLAIGRALMTNPVLLLLDEATEGLAPLIRQTIWSVIEQVKATGMSILVVDKDLESLSTIADRAYVMENGLVVWEGQISALLGDISLQEGYLAL